jgi:Resolvase, N terminal domain
MRVSVSQKSVSKSKVVNRPPEGVVTLHPRLVGYARVSTDEQTTALQHDALRAVGCEPIFEDAASGSAFGDQRNRKST